MIEQTLKTYGPLLLAFLITGVGAFIDSPEVTWFGVGAAFTLIGVFVTYAAKSSE